MSLCTPSTLLKPISLCTDSIVVGYAQEPSTDYKLNFLNLATGAIFSYPVRSNGARLVTITLTDGMNLATGQYYQMYLSSSTNINDAQLLTIGTTEEEYFLFSLFTAYDLYYSDFINFTSQTLEVDE